MTGRFVSTGLFVSVLAFAPSAFAGGPSVPPPPPPPNDARWAPTAPLPVVPAPSELVAVSDDEMGVPPAPPPPDAPTGGDVARTMETAPPVAVAPDAAPPAAVAPSTWAMPCDVAPACPAPCAPAACRCFQRRDDCGWHVDSSGCRYGRFEITLEGTYTLLTDPEGAFGLDSFFPDQLRWNVLDYDGEFGGRAALSFRTTSCDRVEVRGAWMGQFEDAARQTGVFGFAPATPAPPIVPGVIPGVSAPNTGDFRSEADLYTGEFNWWCEQLCEGQIRYDSVLGIRSIWFNEEARADNFAQAFVPGFPGAAFVASDVENWFIGLQGGGAIHWDVNSCFEITLSGKAMVGNLNRKVDVRDQAIFAGGAHSSSIEEDEIVFGGEVEVGLRLRLTRWLAVTGGYNLLFLDNVQRATEAFNFGASASGAVQAQSDTDQIVAHSFFFGLNLNF